MKEKLVIVINGMGGCGKDTLIDLASKHFYCRNVSSVTPIKEMARLGGWHEEKTEAARKMLSDLKAVMTAYNDLPQKYIVDQYNEFLASDEEIMFVHIREPKNIWKFLAEVKNRSDMIVRDASILVKRSSSPESIGNISDDGVESYPYDAVFVNDYAMQESEIKFTCLIKHLLDYYGLSIEAY